jgi:hypothetical protein
MKTREELIIACHKATEVWIDACKAMNEASDWFDEKGDEREKACQELIDYDKSSMDVVRKIGAIAIKCGEVHGMSPRTEPKGCI